MKLKAEDGYYSLKSSGVREWIRDSTFLKKHKAGLWCFVVIVWFGLYIYMLTMWGPKEEMPVIPTIVIIFVIPSFGLWVVYVFSRRLIYGSFRERPETRVDLPSAEFHSLGTCRNYGKRILDMVENLNVADHYIFLLNFHNLFYHDDHRLENPDQSMLNGIARAVRVLPERQRSTVWTKNPLEGLVGGLEAGQEAGEEAIVDNIAKKLGGLPEPREAVSIITKEYLPALMREFPRDVAMYIAVVVCTAQNYTAVFPFDSRVVTENEAVAVASNPTRENVVNYCSKFSGLAVEQPVVRRKGLMED